MNCTNGRIAEQSKDRFANALIKLMEIYDFREITITQLAQESELSRKTFYRLFSDKDSVLNHFLQGMYGECFALIAGSGIEHYWDLVQLYFDFWESQKDMLMLFRKNNLLPKVFDFVYSNSAAVFELIRTTDTARQYSAELPYILAYSVGGMHSMLLKWIELGMAVPSSMLIERLKVGFMSPEL